MAVDCSGSKSQLVSGGISSVAIVPRFRAGELAAVTALVVYAVIFLKNAWLCDDAFIVLRSVEQVYAGNGPRWNPLDRVQAFTSPLWFMALCVVRSLVRDAFWLGLGLSSVCNTAVLIGLRQLLGSGWRFAYCVALLICSNSYFDFTTSGLENSMGYALLVWFLSRYVRSSGSGEEGSKINGGLQTAWLGGLALLCRHDLVTLVAIPVAAVVGSLYRRRGIRGAVQGVAVALGPVGLWTLFSLLYYGMPFPNTYYAKLHAGVGARALAAKGLAYIASGIVWDPILVVVCGAGCMAAALSGFRRTWPLFSAVGAHLLYVIGVGGDFMAGRFLAWDYLWCSVLLFVYAEQAVERIGISSHWCRIMAARGSAIHAAVAVCLLVYAVGMPHTPVNSPASYSNMRMSGDVADERGFYFREASLWAYLRRPKNTLFPVSRLSVSGHLLAFSERDFIPALRIGAFGYWAGTRKTVLDPMALADPFLARLPVPPGAPWRVGHYRREFPRGYVESLRSGVPSLDDPKLNELLRDVFLVTRGLPLLSARRLAAIARLNGVGCGTHCRY